MKTALFRKSFPKTIVPTAQRSKTRKEQSELQIKIYAPPISLRAYPYKANSWTSHEITKRTVYITLYQRTCARKS